MLPTVAIVAVVVLAIFSLLIFAASYGNLSERVDKLAESQSLLSESQVALSEAIQDTLAIVDSLSSEIHKMSTEVEQLSQAVQQQTITALKHQLITVYGGDRTAARRGYELEKSAHPGKGDYWYFKQAVAAAPPLRP